MHLWFFYLFLWLVSSYWVVLPSLLIMLFIMSNCVLICLGWLSSHRYLLFSEQKREREWIWGRRDMCRGHSWEKMREEILWLGFISWEKNPFLIKLKYFLTWKIKKEKRRDRNRISNISFNEEIYLVSCRMTPMCKYGNMGSTKGA